MTAIEVSNSLAVLVNKDALEPDEYFTILKASGSSIDAETLQTQLNFVAAQIKKAKKLGQKNFAEWLEFSARVLTKELVLPQFGVTQFVHRVAVADFIEKVTPKHSVKIIELERYPRIIPDAAAEKIERVKNEGLFDGILVVFTDFSDKKHQSKKDKEFIARNRDPIAFGFFKEPESGDTHHRLYHIADWADDQCDLSFDKVLDSVEKGQWGTLSVETIQAPTPPQSAIKKVIRWMTGRT